MKSSILTWVQNRLRRSDTETFSFSVIENFSPLSTDIIKEKKEDYDKLGGITMDSNKYFSFASDIFDEEYLECRLEEKVNDGLLNYSNHIQDNGFFEDTLKEVVKSMRERKYEPVGISLNPPFECAYGHSIAFVMRIDGEIYWVHMPETYWFHLIADYCGRKHANIIISEIKGKKIMEE